MQYAFAQVQQAFEGIFANLPIPILGGISQGLVMAWWRLNPIGLPPSDGLGHEVAHLLQTPGETRDRLTANIYIPSHPDEPLGRLEQALRLSLQAEAILKTIKAASHVGQLPQAKPETLIEVALSAAVITPAEAQLVREAETARNDAIQVDAFSLEDYQKGTQPIPATMTLV